MRKLLVGFAAASLAVPVLAQVSVGLRAAYAFPLGDALGGQAIGQSFKESDLYRGVIPVQVEASWRITPRLSAGLYGSYGYGFKGKSLKDFCDLPGASCPAPVDWRYGAQAAWSFGPQGPVEPWVGLGGGMRIAHFKVKNFTTQVPNPAPPPALVPFTGDLDGSLRGWELNVQGGADWRLLPQLVAGPYLQAAVGQYRVQDVSYGSLGTVAGGGVDSPQTHGFITVGLRGRFDL
jgi:hypothetical protein